MATGRLFNPFMLGAAFWWPTLVVILGFYPLNTYLYITGLRLGELSRTVPLQSLGPVLALGPGVIFLHQAPTLLALCAIVTIMVGVYVLNLSGHKLHNPLHIFSRDRANLYVLGSLLLVAAASVLDKLAIEASGAAYYSFVSTLGAVIVLYIAARIRGVRQAEAVRRDFRQLAVAGSLFGASYVMFSLALHSGPLAYVSAVRNISILFGALTGVVHFKERLTRPKLAGLIIIMAGVTVLGLS